MAPISMRVEWKCASMTSGEQCVMTPGTALMLLWFVISWDMQTIKVCNIHHLLQTIYILGIIPVKVVTDL